MKNLLFMAAMLMAAIASEGAEMQHLGDATVSHGLHHRTADRQLLNTASINGVVACVFLLGMAGFAVMRICRRYALQETYLCYLQPALAENAGENAWQKQLFNTIAREFMVIDRSHWVDHDDQAKTAANLQTTSFRNNRTGEAVSSMLDNGLTSPVTVAADSWPGSEGTSSDRSAEAAHNSKDSVLVVEDNTDMREYIATILRDRNYTVFSACNGEEAINLTLNYIPSLVLSDLMMPKMDGLEMTRRLKQDERTSHIPVILLTARSEVESKLVGLKTGADDYLTKPFLPEELLVRIGNLIEQRKKLQGKFRERILVNPTPGTEMPLDSRFLNKALTVVESNLSNCTFTVEKMADEMNLSRTQLLRKLKALTGLSPNDFIKDIRLKRAADMISRKTDTMTQIGFAVGFNDQSYFTKCFKKQFGMTPSEFSANAAGHEQ